ncbi:gluconolaconase [Acrocarpospora macrocephala]|uniref:Gluconolaconase n=1 Tax=Acrocarpospora macrocephala TaxID=150177 RepID=A0A5M3WE53_9ACTN|nr:gluconolaconase [Acrocarpospora macrocephala]
MPPAKPSTSPELSSTGQRGVGPLAPVPLEVAGGVDAGAAGGRSLNLPAGWTAEVWANVPGARLAAWAPDKRLVVSTGDRRVVSILTPGAAGQAPAVATLLDGLDNPQGLAFTQQDGRTILVVGEKTRLVAFDYADGAVSNRRVIIDGLPGGGHGSKAVAVQDGIVYYNVGSGTNRDPVDRTSVPERGTVARVGLDGTGNRTIATGVRNGFGLSFAPDGTLFVAVNQADNQPYPFRDDTGQYGQTVRAYINENPVEQVSRVTPGTDLGWPYCVPDTRGSRDLLNLPYVNDPINNPDGRALDCGSIGRTMVGLPAHSAPLGLAFTHDSTLPEPLRNGALITAHGSWNRQPPRPPYVAYSAWDSATNTLGVPVELVTGFQDANGSRWGRSVTAVPGPDGSIYLTDDKAGLVYRLTPGG